MALEGYIHSIETFGTLDGPGIRYVIFMQGCPLRCAFCHNPDTWRMVHGQKKTVAWFVEDIKNYLPYFRSSGGGLTVSGGEPLLQASFLTLLFSRLKKLNIHKAVDTSGFAEVEKIKELMSLTDLVMLSIKHPDPDRHREICGQSNDRPLALSRYLSRIMMPVWIRYVLIPQVSSDRRDLEMLAQMIYKMPNVERLELLPYHTMGTPKWRALGLKSPLLDSRPPTEQEIQSARQYMQSLLPDLKII